MINAGDFVEGKAEKSHSVISAILADNSIGMRLKQCCKPYNIIVDVYIYIYITYILREHVIFVLHLDLYHKSEL